MPEISHEQKKLIAVGLIGFLGGMVIGFLLSPIKHGIGNHSGNTKNYYGAKDTNEEDEEE